MSRTTRTSPEEGKDAFGRGLGLAHQLGVAFGKEGVTPTMLQSVRSNPLHLRRVTGAIKGEDSVTIKLDDLIARELEYVSRFSEISGYGASINFEAHIKRALDRTGEQMGVLTVDDRFILGQLCLEPVFEFFYRFNERQEARGETPINLCQNPGQEDWRSWRDAEVVPSDMGVLRLNFATAMQAIDLKGRPFNCTHDDQVACAKERQVDGIMSVVETLYSFARCVLEEGRPLWAAGSARCRDRCGPDGSLNVYWNAEEGLNVAYYDHEDYDWLLGALLRKFVALEL